MKNGIESLYSYNHKNRCSICNSENISTNITKIKNNKLKKIISKIEQEELINKCKCSNEEKNVHKICLLFNIIFNFETKCRQCKSNYNINIDKTINNSKKLCKLFSYLFLTLFHIILFAASVILILYILVIKKDNGDDFEKKKYDHIYIFFGIILFIINIILIPITYSHFIDKNAIDIYDYTINVYDEKEPIKIKNDSDTFYSLLYEFYRYFYDTRIRYLISKKHSSLFFSSGYGNFNKEIKKMMKENNELISNNINIINKVEEEKNEFHYTGTLGNFNQKKIMESKNISQNNSNDKNSKDTNPINLQLSLIKKNFEEDKYSHKENMDDILIINNNLKSDREKQKEKKSERNTFNSISIYSNKKFNLISKSCFYKKIDQKKLFLKSRTYKTKSDRKKDKKENTIKIEEKKIPNKMIKINDSGSEKKYVDSTFLLKNENNNDKDKPKNL
jgi:hypothetical protein